ncbi:hypothetical protein BD413DRAFT_617746 [Trametes elegans]|nr:hypothetical protein BD413DRAFT_618164 [Trametes elegans]KAI0759448.1 hypothetical protein BD413DRAFT_617746 [Trametes elegans]
MNVTECQCILPSEHGCEKLLSAPGALSTNDQIVDAVCADVKQMCAGDSEDLSALAEVAGSWNAQAQADTVEVYEPLIVPSTGSYQLACAPPEVSSHEVEMKPDFTAVDVPPPVLHGSPSDPVSAKDGDWTCFSAFIAVKARTSELPTTPDSINAINSLTQAADYARIILAALPFQLNAYGASSADTSSP